MIALNLDGLIYVIILVMLLPPLILFGIGYSVREKNEKTTKIMYILAAAYFLIGFGICFGGF